MLQLLDKNGDKKLSGLELRSLRLWFDANSDAISDPGEVVDLDSKGVSVIFITPDERSDEVGLVRASKGFIRKDDNGTFVGAWVDWFAGTAKDSNTLMEKLSMSAPFEVGANTFQQLSYIEKPPSHYNINADIAGVGEFNADSGRPPKEKDHGPQGDLAISELKDGTLEAASFGTLDFSDGSLPGIAQMLKIHLLQGKKEDKNRYSFLLQTKETRVETTAVLDPETKTLKGESRGYVKAREGQTVELSYKWTARRLPPPLNNGATAKASATHSE